MFLPIAQAVLASLSVYLVWRIFIAKSTLSNIPGPPGQSWWKGCFFQVFDEFGWKFHREILKKYGSVVRLPMLFGDEQLFVSDPLALHHITVKDQYVYEETSMFITSNSLVFGTSLLSTLGEHHRKQRKMLNPVFSLKHMRDLLPVFYPIAYELRDVLAGQVKGGTTEFDVMHWVSRAALEYIGRGGFGYSFNALQDEESSAYGEQVKKIGPMLFRTIFYRQFLPWVANIGSPAFRRKVLEFLPSRIAKEACELVDSLTSHSTAIFEHQKSSLDKDDDEVQRQVGAGKDIMSVLLKANMAANENDRLPEEELIGQINTFILAGQDTTTHAVARILHQLVLHPDEQSRLREEIVTARKERGYSDFDYDTLMSLPYLDAVCRETLRVFPPLTMVSRTTRKDIVMPLAWPITSADRKSQITEIPIKKNTNIIISILGANISKKVWGEDAEEWKPERWLKPLPESVSQAHLPGIYASMMTFIGGGRACIGFKFAEMEMKLVLSLLLETFDFAAGPELEWAMSGIARPLLKDSLDKSPQLPLKVSFLKNKCN